MGETTGQLKKLNLGSGEFLKEGFVNVDFYSVSNPDVVHNLDEFPYPFEDNEFDHIEADHVLEHLHHPFKVMKELHRIGKPGATIIIRVPHFSRGFTHADHKRGFDATFPFYFQKSFIGGYQGVEINIEKTRMTWFAQPYLKKTVMSTIPYYVGRIMGGFFDFFANLSPLMCSRLWCFSVGGFEQIEFRFRVPKDKS